MNTVQLRLIGTKEECMTLVALISQVAPVEIKRIDKADRGSTSSPRRRIYAEIHTRIRNP